MKTCPVCDTPYPDQHNTCPADGALLILSRELGPGQIVRGKYRIVRKLGQGGMGVVYLAEHMLLGGQLALKFLAAELSRDPQFVKRFRNEAKAAYQLRHPNIVEVVDLDQDEDGSLFIAMEFVSGLNLRMFLRETRDRVPVERALQVACGVAAGLAAAHARGAVHRDIKPENILLCPEPNGGIQPKVLDFGIAALSASTTDQSRTRGLLLTPQYAAPEQWRGTPANELDGRTDLYALGGVLYEMLSGRTPFQATNPEGWMFQHLQGVPEPLETLRPGFSRNFPELDAIVVRLLAREREQRFASATALLVALESARLPKAPAVKPFAKPASRQVAKPASPKPELKDPRPLSAEPENLSRVQVKGTTEREAAPNAGGELFASFSAAPRAKLRMRDMLAPLAGLGSLALVVAAICIRIAITSDLPMTARPVISPVGGNYPEAQVVRITDVTPNAVIHYTLNGDQATESSAVYREPLASLPSGAVVSAMAKAPGRYPSSEAFESYQWPVTPAVAANPKGGTPKKLILASTVMAANLIKETPPEYPANAKAARIQGTVVLQATISKNGSVQNLKVLSGPQILRNAALEAVRSWRYKPYLLYDYPVDVETTVVVDFNLDK
jgi:TonB family protein